MANNATTAPAPRRDEGDASQRRWEAVNSLQCTLSVDVAVPGITIGDLLKLDVGSIVSTYHSKSDPAPVLVNGVTVARGDFEAIGDRLAVRISEIC